MVAIKLQKLDELTPEEIKTLSPEDISELISMYNDVVRSMNIIFESLHDTGELIIELFRSFISEDNDD